LKIPPKRLKMMPPYMTLRMTPTKRQPRMKTKRVPTTR
jgi:hypothetical protein